MPQSPASEKTGIGARKQELPSPSLHLTPQAAKQVAFLRNRDGNEALMLRLGVTGGGCSGFQYHFSFDGEKKEEDRLFMTDGVTLVVDEMSLSLLDGSEIDYVQDMMGASFKVRNPNAASSCGCGSSFAI